MIQVTCKGGTVKEVAAGTTAADLVKEIGMGLYKAACACKIDGEVCDLRTPLEQDCSFEVLTFDDPEGKKVFWHSASHLLAQAVKRLYPDAKLSIGPAIDNGFYYDFDLETPFTPDELEALEKEMKALCKAGMEITRFTLPADEARKLMEERGEPYKLELIEEHAGKGDKLSFYRQGEFIDLCAGPHLMTTAPLKAIKLTNCTGAYWRGDATNKQLCRVYGVAFPKASALTEHLERLEEAKKRDHRRIGKEMDLFMFRDEAPGFPFFLPKGMLIKNALIDYWREFHTRENNVVVSTP